MGSMKPGVGDDPFGDEENEDDDEASDVAESEALSESTSSSTAASADGDDGGRDRVGELADVLEAIDDGDERAQLSVRYPTAKALAKLLQDDAELREVLAADLRAAGEDVEAADLDESELLRCVFRVALRDASPETLELLQDAKGEFGRRSI